MSHYFTNNDDLKDEEKEIDFYFGGEKFSFKTNSGMFSPDSVDEGTIIMLENIKSLNGDILDLGCAYGVVGITMGKIFKEQIKSITMSDVNERALEYAKENLAKNEMQAKLVVSDALKSIDGTFDNIILNPPIHAGKKKIFEMYEESFEKLNKGGNLYLVIRQKHGASSTMKKLEELGFKLELPYKKKGVYVVKSEK